MAVLKHFLLILSIFALCYGTLHLHTCSSTGLWGRHTTPIYSAVTKIPAGQRVNKLHIRVPDGQTYTCTATNNPYLVGLEVVVCDAYVAPKVHFGRNTSEVTVSRRGLLQNEAVTHTVYHCDSHA